MEHSPMRCRSYTPPTILLALTLLVAGPVPAQDFRPDPADVEAIKALLRKSQQAMLDKDWKAFVACCDDYVDCFFLDGTLIQGRKRIEATLYGYFSRRPEGLVAKLEVVPRSYRVLTPDIIMVDWPATVQGPDGVVKVNTLTTVRKVQGRWSITSYLESVPYTGRIGGRNAPGNR
jgi:uncharacterized protein (TIGR02246 family)